MTTFKAVTTTAIVTGALLVALSGCEKGPAEKVGEKIDKSVEHIGKSLENAGDSMRDASRAAED